MNPRIYTFLGLAFTAMCALLVMGMSSEEGALIDQLGSDAPEVRLHAARMLARTNSDRAAECLASLAGDANTEVATVALMAIGSMARNEDGETLKNAVGDSRAPVRRAAVTALGDLGEARHADILIRVLRDDPVPAVRAAAADAMGRLRSRGLVPALIAALADPSLLVRGRAGAAIRRLSGRDFGFRAGDAAHKRRQVTRKIAAWWNESAHGEG